MSISIFFIFFFSHVTSWMPPEVQQLKELLYLAVAEQLLAQIAAKAVVNVTRA